MPVNPFGDPEFMQLLGASMFGAISPDGRANFASPAINAWMTGRQLAQREDEFKFNQQSEIAQSERQNRQLGLQERTQERLERERQDIARHRNQSLGLDRDKLSFDAWMNVKKLEQEKVQREQQNRQLSLQEEAQRRLERERQDTAKYREQSYELDWQKLSFAQRKLDLDYQEKVAYERAAGEALKNFINPELAEQYVAAGMAAEVLDTYTKDSLKKEEAKARMYQTFVEALQYAQIQDPGKRKPRPMTPEEIDKKAREMSGYNPQASRNPGNSDTVDFSDAFGSF